jgi:HPt (histidine-containing phosphotransfer) domain-containing protein
MNDHIAKPISPKVLFETLLKWIEHKDRELPDLSAENAAGQEPVGSLPDLPGIDTASGIARVGGNVRSYRKLLVKFADSQADAIDTIRTAHANGDPELSVRLAHTLKGVGGAIGATELQRAAAELEGALADGPAGLPVPLLTAVQGEVDRVLALLRDLVSERSPEQTAVAELPENIAARLQALMVMLEENDSESEDLLEGILQEVAGTILHSPLQALGKPIGRYDFGNAASELQTIIEENCSADTA